MLTVYSLAQLAFIYFTSWNLAPDEAHYWDWSKRPDLSYYSKGPGVAILINYTTLLFGDTEFGVRFGAWASNLLLSLAIFFPIARLTNPSFALGSFLCIRSMLFFSFLGVLMTTDPAMLACYMLALASGFDALTGKKSAWLLFGVFCGIGALFKFTILVLPVSLLLLAFVSKPYRGALRSKSFLAGLAIIFLILAPILYWNSQHGWVTFLHNSGHLVSQKGLLFRPKFFAELIGGQLGLIGPILFFLILVSIVKAYRRWRSGDYVVLYFLAPCLILGGLCLALSFTKPIYANWPAPFYLTWVMLFAYLHRTNPEEIRPIKNYLAPAIGLNFIILVGVIFLLSGFTLGISGDKLPMKKLIGWNSLGEQAVKLMLRNSAEQGKLSGILTENYDVASALSFYTKTDLPIVVGNFNDRRMNQFDIWGGFAELKGKDLFLVLRSPSVAPEISKHFRAVTRIEPAFRSYYSNTKISEFYFFRGKGFDGVKLNIAGKY